MATPPPPFDPLGLSLFNAGFRPEEPARPTSSQVHADKPPKGPRRTPLVQMLCWLIGAVGYVGLLIASHGARHADDLRGLAVAWLFVFGALNAYFILKRR
jgi:hypothetical protein